MVFFPIVILLAVESAHAFQVQSSAFASSGGISMESSYRVDYNHMGQHQGSVHYPCDNHYCHLHGQCTWYNQQIYCHCDDTHTGQYCQFLISSATAGSCGRSYCNNQGNCVHNNGVHTCDCDHGFAGDRCELTAGSCDRSYCNNHGNCVNNNGVHTCHCDHDFAGYRCELTNYCLGGHCQHGSTCIPGYFAPNYFQCICPSGYTGTFCETEMHGSQWAVTTHAPVTTHKPSTTSTTTTTPKPTTTTSTTTSTTATTTTTTTTAPTTTQAYVFNSCMKFAVITTIARNASVDIAGAPACPDGSHTSSEAFPLSTCNVPQPVDWKQGKRVMDDCASIPAYTPIATFLSGTYPVGQGLAGVFLECLNPGFKMALQSCVHSPVIIHVESGTLTDPNIYYTIQ